LKDNHRISNGGTEIKAQESNSLVILSANCRVVALLVDTFVANDI
jgi:hypothetical protein